jgi:bacillithiol biosynthesis deacetylase BshB1
MKMGSKQDRNRRLLDILVFSPHPDDAELGCGGSLMMASDRGLLVGIADLSKGERSSQGTPEQREREREEATELLKLSHRFSLGLPDTEIGLHSNHVYQVVELIRKTRPRIVLSPYWEDRHPDHEAAGRLIRRACFFSGVGTVGEGPLHRPERVYYYMIHSPFTPSFVMDISNVWEQKVALMEIFASQFKNKEDGFGSTAISHPNFLRFQKARAVYFGALSGVAFGEPYLSIAQVPVRAFPGTDDFEPPQTNVPPYCAF